MLISDGKCSRWSVYKALENIRKTKRKAWKGKVVGKNIFYWRFRSFNEFWKKMWEQSLNRFEIFLELKSYSPQLLTIFKTNTAFQALVACMPFFQFSSFEHHRYLEKIWVHFSTSEFRTLEHFMVLDWKKNKYLFWI